MGRTVLIAESNLAFLKVLESTFGVLGFSVVGTASEPSEIAAIAHKTRPDLLIFDLSLSKGGVKSVSDLKQLKQQLPGLKILATGFHEAVDEIIEPVLKAGFDAFWSKSDNRAGFLRTLSALFPDFVKSRLS